MATKIAKTIVYAAFKGMGDLLNAAPVVRAQLDAGHWVKLFLFPKMGLEEFTDLTDFGENRGRLEVLSLPVSGALNDLRAFFRHARRFKADFIWISPHAPRGIGSWKIPLLLWLTRAIFWPDASLAGAESERMSFLFDIQVRVDRDLPLARRESLAFSMAQPEGAVESYLPSGFIDRVQKDASHPPEYDLLIHPGANASNRSWPFSYYGSLLRLIPQTCRIAVLGLQGDLERMRGVLSSERQVQYIAGSLEEALTAIARARVVFCMDSGTAHFAQALGIPAVVLFGKSDPDTIVGRNGSVFPIYERNFPCQPCGRAVCNQPEVYCMNSISPETVAGALGVLLARTESAREEGFSPSTPARRLRGAGVSWRS